jgi:hypothetical protein
LASCRRRHNGDHRRSLSKSAVGQIAFRQRSVLAENRYVDRE